jgi:hypothetical protein
MLETKVGNICEFTISFSCAFIIHSSFVSYCRDVISMPDKWEYPWFAAWDLAFHVVPFAHLDPEFAKSQLRLFLREWYMHPNGQIPAYEFNFSDVNPPVGAWAAWRIYKMTTDKKDERDRGFLESVFLKLLLNFTWWVNRKDPENNNLFGGGFLGLDNIGVFDRSAQLPEGGTLHQSDGTAWMCFFCLTMFSISVELAGGVNGEPVIEAYEDMASKFFEHFVQIVDAMNIHGGTGLWDEEDGFYYDQVKCGKTNQVICLKSEYKKKQFTSISERSVFNERYLTHYSNELFLILFL